MNEVTSALADIEIGLERLGRRILLGALRPGLDADQTRMLLRGCDLPGSEQVESLKLIQAVL